MARLSHDISKEQEGQHPLTGQRAAISGYWPTSEPNAG